MPLVIPPPDLVLLGTGSEVALCLTASEQLAARGIRTRVASTTEGDDKPAKYPQMFAVSQVMIVNKLDLLPYIDFDLEKAKRQALAINPHLRIFEVSCRTGIGLDNWCEWLLAFAHGKIS